MSVFSPSITFCCENSGPASFSPVTNWSARIHPIVAISTGSLPIFVHPLEVLLDLGDLRLLLERDEPRDHDRALEQLGVGGDEAGVVAVRQVLHRVEALLLHLLAEDDDLVDVHARGDEVDARRLHLRDLRR